MGDLFAYAKNLDHHVAQNDIDNAILWKSNIADVGMVLGFLQQDPEDWFKSGVDDDFKARIDELVAARDQARAGKDWAEADRLRHELTALNIEVMDAPGGATWKVKTGN
jgi:cysteinyl-tRNA synthetase